MPDSKPDHTTLHHQIADPAHIIVWCHFLRSARGGIEAGDVLWSINGVKVDPSATSADEQLETLRTMCYPATLIFKRPADGSGTCTPGSTNMGAEHRKLSWKSDWTGGSHSGRSAPATAPSSFRWHRGGGGEEDNDPVVDASATIVEDEAAGLDHSARGSSSPPQLVRVEGVNALHQSKILLYITRSDIW